MTFHCFFEQSGTFKNEFKKLGYEAYDYDILNGFGETDYVIDLFAEIEKAYGGGSSIFDNISKEDQIIAFFPCTRFEDQIVMCFKGEQYQMEKWSDTQKLENDIRLHNELNELYVRVCQLALICIQRDIPLIIENPRGTLHYLNRYWSIKPSVIDSDRTERGDYYKKPTQYWFINRKPSNNLLLDTVHLKTRRVLEDVVNSDGIDRKTLRSLISPDYANRFIREFII